MKFINQTLIKKYQRWTTALSEAGTPRSDYVIDTLDLINLHFTVVDYFLENDCKEIGEFGPKGKDLLSVTLGRQIGEHSKNLKWKTHYEKCAALYYGLIKNQIFYGFNRRTALLTMLYYLAKLRQTLKVSNKELEIITCIIASNEIRNREGFKPYTKFEDGEIRFLAQYFHENTRPLNEIDHIITYGELKRELGAFGFSLNNLHGNSIDIVRTEKRPELLGILKRQNKETVVGNICFSGWTQKVAGSELDAVREYTGLGSLKIVREIPTIPALIYAYREVLDKIAKK